VHVHAPKVTLTAAQRFCNHQTPDARQDDFPSSGSAVKADAPTWQPRGPTMKKRRAAGACRRAHVDAGARIHANARVMLTTCHITNRPMMRRQCLASGQTRGGNGHNPPAAPEPCLPRIPGPWRPSPWSRAAYLKRVPKTRLRSCSPDDRRAGLPPERAIASTHESESAERPLRRTCRGVRVGPVDVPAESAGRAARTCSRVKITEKFVIAVPPEVAVRLHHRAFEARRLADVEDLG
jgi:hypothetical protein